VCGVIRKKYPTTFLSYNKCFCGSRTGLNVLKAEHQQEISKLINELVITTTIEQYCQIFSKEINKECDQDYAKGA
jgi:hypothetical protein